MLSCSEWTGMGGTYFQLSQKQLDLVRIREALTGLCTILGCSNSYLGEHTTVQDVYGRRVGKEMVALQPAAG